MKAALQDVSDKAECQRKRINLYTAILPTGTDVIPMLRKLSPLL